MKPRTTFGLSVLGTMLFATTAPSKGYPTLQSQEVVTAEAPKELLEDCPRDVAGACILKFVALDARIPGECEMGRIACNVGSMKCKLPRDKVIPIIREALYHIIVRRRLVAAVNDETDTAILLIASAAPPDKKHKSFYRFRADFQEIDSGINVYAFDSENKSCRVFLSSKKIDIPIQGNSGSASWSVTDDLVTAEAINESWKRLSAYTIEEYRGQSKSEQRGFKFKR